MKISYQTAKRIFNVLVLSFVAFLCIVFSSCHGTAKIHAPESFSGKNTVISPCNECDQDGGIYIYAVMSKKDLPAPPSVSHIKGVISLKKKNKNTYYLCVSPLYNQKDVLKKVYASIYK